MKFPHVVKYNGVRYPAGTDVPIEVETAPVVPQAETVEIPKPPTNKEVMQMRKADLIELAERNGIKNADTYSAAKLRVRLIEMFDL